MNAQVDEETPLLQSPPAKKTPLPWLQLTIVLFLHLPEPLGSLTISPFAPQLMRDIGITHGDETRVGYYVGLMQSLFFLTQALAMFHWNSTSDRVGRKPVILTGLFGLSVSMFCIGLSRTYWGVVMSRCLNGALNSNIGVIKSMMVEMTDSTNIAQAYAYMPIAWATAGTLGPIVGGSLSRPADRFPRLFGHNEFLKKYPYFLPCAVPATYAALTWLVTFLFLKETVRSPASIFPTFKFLRNRNGRTIGRTEEQCRPSVTDPNLPATEKPLPLRALLTRPVILAVGNYTTLSLMDISFRAIQPLFLSTPVALGGLGLPPPTIGKILSVFGVVNGTLQVFFFARINDTLGSKTTFMIGILSMFSAFIAFPIINSLARTQGLSTTVWFSVALQTFLSIGPSLSFGAIFIFIAAASPNRASLGATNGLSQMAVSFVRAIGPAVANSLFSLSIKNNYLQGHLVYYVLVAMVGVATYVGSLLPRKLWND